MDPEERADFISDAKKLAKNCKTVILKRDWLRRTNGATTSSLSDMQFQIWCYASKMRTILFDCGITNYRKVGLSHFSPQALIEIVEKLK